MGVGVALGVGVGVGAVVGVAVGVAVGVGVGASLGTPLAVADGLVDALADGSADAGGSAPRTDRGVPPSPPRSAMRIAVRRATTSSVGSELRWLRRVSVRGGMGPQKGSDAKDDRCHPTPAMTGWCHDCRTRPAGQGYATTMPIRCFLGHGASGSSASMAPFVEGLRARGVSATAIDLPRRKAEDAIPAFHLVVPSAANVAVGGHSYGGRVASLAAAEPEAPYVALVLFSYPLHPPGAPERTDARIAHWPAIRCPVLLLSGESDPFARIDLLRASVSQLKQAELVTYPRLGHTLKPVLENALDRAATFLLGIAPR